jgi:nucleoside-diphosphate-sugar epimerase
LGAFDNRRSFCSVYNLCFVISELIQRKDIPSGIYNVADDEPISTNRLIKLIADKFNRKIHLLNIPKPVFSIALKFASLLGMNSVKIRFQKLTENFIVSNSKIKLALGKELPISANEGIKKTLESFD